MHVPSANFSIYSIIHVIHTNSSVNITLGEKSNLLSSIGGEVTGMITIRSLEAPSAKIFKNFPWTFKDIGTTSFRLLT